MKTYLLAMHQPDGPPPSPEQLASVMSALGVIKQEMTDAGSLVFSAGLFPPSAATTVRYQPGIPRDGSFRAGQVDDTMLTDGPYTEAREHLGGLWIITVPDLDDALGYAQRICAATTLPIEVRPFHT